MATKKAAAAEPPANLAITTLQRRRKMIEKQIADLRATIKSISLYEGELNKRLDERNEIDDALEALGFKPADEGIRAIGQ